MALGNLDAARDHLRRAVQLGLNSAAVHRDLGMIGLKQKQLGNAQREFELALQFQPDDYPSLYGLGLSHLLQKQPAQALIQFTKAYGLNKSDPSLLMGMLDAHIQLGQKSEASAILAELDAKLDGNYDQQLQLAGLLVNEGAYDLGIEELERLRKTNPDSPELDYDLALAYHRAGHQTAAATLLHSMLAHRDDAELEDLLGDVEGKSGNHTQALLAYQRAIKLEPSNEEYQFDYAEELATNWNPNQALEVFANNIKNFPQSAKMWLGWGATYYLVGKYPEAAKTLLHAAEIAPKNPDVYQLLGLVYEAAGSLQEAVANQFSAYLRTDPPDARAHYYYGKMLVVQSRHGSQVDLTQAKRELERAIQLNPNLAPAYTELATLLSMRGQTEAARNQLETAVRLDPESSEAYYQLMQVYRKLGQHAQAQDAYRKFEQLKAKQGETNRREQVKGFFSEPRQ